MRWPEGVAAEIADVRLEDGRVAEVDELVRGSTYPPPGYVPWNELEVGNGDTHGFYWPLGREDEAPIVCASRHDNWELVPIASAFEPGLRLLTASARSFDPDDEEPDEVARELGVDVADVRGYDEGGLDFWEAASAEPLLELDPRSPHLLTLAHAKLLERGDLDGARRALAEALEILPEYGDAHYLLAGLLRRTGDGAGALRAAIDALTSPVAFGKRVNRSRALEWLQRAPDDALGGDDPIWRERNALTLADGVRDNPDYDVYERAIEAYHECGEGVRAVRLRIVVGELMTWETTSFRERRGWSQERHAEQLAADLERAGLEARLPAARR